MPLPYLPPEVRERIASYTGIDERLALRVRPGRLVTTGQQVFRIRPYHFPDYFYSMVTLPLPAAAYILSYDWEAGDREASYSIMLPPWDNHKYRVPWRMCY